MFGKMGNVGWWWGYIGIYASGCRGVFELILHPTKHTIIRRHIWTPTHVVPYTILQLPAYVRTAYGTIYPYSTHELTRLEFRRTATAKITAARSNPIMSCPTSDTMVEVTGFVLRFCFCILLF